MSNPISLAELASLADGEIARLGRVENIDAVSDLRFRIWPFLIQLVEAVQAELEFDDSPAVPEDLIVKAMALIVALSSVIGKPVTPAEHEHLATVVNEVIDELAAHLDPELLSQLMAQAPTTVAPTQPSAATATTIEALSS